MFLVKSKQKYDENLASGRFKDDTNREMISQRLYDSGRQTLNDNIDRSSYRK